MATLIQSKQIEGIVTASVIEGAFTVQSGSVDLAGATGVTGSFSGSFIGDGSQLTFGGTNLVSGSSQITISQTAGYTAFSSSIAASIAGIVDTDDQTLSFNQVSKELTISDGNTVDLSSLGGGGGGGSSIWTTGSNFYKVSSNLQVTGSFSATSLTGSIDYSNLTNTPSGLFSGSIIGGSNITITSGSGNITIASTGGGVSDYNSLSNVPSGIISSSIQVINLLPSGVVSGSSQVLDGSGVVSGSVLRTLDGTGVLSGSIVAQLPSGIISGSAFTTFSSSVDSRLDTLENATDNTGSDTQTLSISGDQLTISDGNTVTIPTGSGGSVPAGTISGSAQITAFGFTSGSHTDIPSGTISSSAQVISSLPNGTVSGSTQITDGSGIFSGSLVAGTNITINQSGNDFIISSSGESTPVGTISSSAQVVSSLPDGVISGSSQLPSGLVSESAQTLVHLDGTNIFSGSFIPGANITITSGSGNITITAANDGTSDYNNLINVPSGIVSSSSQLTSSYDSRYLNTNGDGVVSGSVLRSLDGTNVVSESAQVISLLPNGVISGSEQLPSGLVSGSSQVLDGSGVVSGSVLRTLDGTGVVSGSVLRTLDGTGVVSGSVLRTLDGTSVVSSSTQVVSLLPDGVFSGSIIGDGNITVTSGSGNITISGSGGSSDTTFDGDRIISNEDLGDLFTNAVNPGTSGSIQDFLNAVFYPNSAPTITTGNQTIEEFRASGATIVTLAATDPENQSLTFGTASSYTDDLVRVSSAGAMTLNALAESSSFNTDSVGGSHGHLVTVKVTDTFSSTTEKDIYVIVTPNAAPQFRETSIAGNVITSVTANLNENSTDNTLVKRVYFTDAESDSITITTSSIDNDHFDITVYSNYLDIRQNTASLDYETQTTYTFSVTASDEHYPSQDSDSITTLPITVNVVDNLVPTISSQVVGSINENSSNGASVGSISAADNESDSITFIGFDLHKLVLDGSTVASSSYSGTSQLTDPHENPFNMDSSGNVTRKNGVFLNSDLINEYQYRVKVKDNFNATISSASVVTVNIDDDIAATITDNWSAGPYIKESETSGTTIKTTNYGSTQADYNANQSGTWSSSNSAISINSNGNLSLNVDLSGSLTQSGDTISSTITFTNTFGTTTTDNLSVSVVANQAPTATFSNQSSNLNQNLATTNANLVLVTITDSEGDTPYSASLTGTDASKLNLNYTNSNSSSVYIRANENLTAGTYTYNLKVTDDYNKSTEYNNRTIVIASPDTGTLTGDTTSYIIESAESGSLIRENSNGRTGNQADLNVSYSPNYGSQAVASFTSSLSEIVVSSTGLLSLNVDISGSSTSSGDTISPTITWRDQYDNVGSSAITINVATNQAPTATFTDQSANFETDLSIAGATMVSMSITDDESDTPFSASLTGTNASDLQLRYVNSTSSSVGIQAASNLSAGTYNYNVKVTDNFGKSREYNGRSFTVIQSSDYGKTYVYRSSYGSDAGLSSNYLALMGASTVNGDTPPEVTAYTANDTSPFRLISSSLGDSTLSLAGGETANLVATISGSDLDTILNDANPLTMGNTAEQYIIIVPSGSDMIGIPTSMTDGFGDNTVGRYVMAIKADGGSWGQEASTIHLLDTSGSFNGYDKHFVIGRTGHNSAASVEIRIIEASGSLPS